jgi:hypothetical protein
MPARLIIDDSGPRMRMNMFEKESAINEDIPVMIKLKIITSDNTFTIGTNDILAK